MKWSTTADTARDAAAVKNDFAGLARASSARRRCCSSDLHLLEKGPCVKLFNSLFVRCTFACPLPQLLSLSGKASIIVLPVLKYRI